MLVEDGIILIKYWFLVSITKWEDYSRAKDAMFEATDHACAPWWTIGSDDERASRINTISHLLSQVPYESRDLDDVTIPLRGRCVFRRSASLSTLSTR